MESITVIESLILPNSDFARLLFPHLLVAAAEANVD